MHVLYERQLFCFQFPFTKPSVSGHSPDLILKRFLVISCHKRNARMKFKCIKCKLYFMHLPELVALALRMQDSRSTSRISCKSLLLRMMKGPFNTSATEIDKKCINHNADRWGNDALFIIGNFVLLCAFCIFRLTIGFKRGTFFSRHEKLCRIFVNNYEIFTAFSDTFVALFINRVGRVE